MTKNHPVYGKMSFHSGLIGGIVLLSTLAVVVAGCTNQPVAANPAEVSGSAAGISASISQATQSNLWLEAKSGPYWSLLSLDPGNDSFSNITPVGISSRGGFAAATNGNGVGAVAFYPYVSMVDSPVFITTNQAKSWRTLQLEAGLVKVTHAVALSSDRIFALEDQGGKEVLGSMSFSGQDQPITIPRSLKIKSIYGESSGLVALADTKGGAAMYSFDEASGAWRQITSPLANWTPLDIYSLDLTSAPELGQVVASCYLDRHRPSQLDEVIVSDGVAHKYSAAYGYPSSELIGCGLNGDGDWFVTLKLHDSYALVSPLSLAGSKVAKIPAITGRFDLASASGQVFAYRYTGSSLKLYQLNDRLDFGPTIDSYLQKLFNKLSGGAAE
ncbi:MAG: hypothetical protein HKL81_00725 [Acidimicrobiaceae bacterium]|nr:hypothetical protein [Acidimicrobiaceae bacterium]